jgi:cell division protease FtsH
LLLNGVLGFLNGSGIVMSQIRVKSLILLSIFSVTTFSSTGLQARTPSGGDKISSVTVSKEAFVCAAAGVACWYGIAALYHKWAAGQKAIITARKNKAQLDFQKKSKVLDIECQKQFSADKIATDKKVLDRQVAASKKILDRQIAASKKILDMQVTASKKIQQGSATAAPVFKVYNYAGAALASDPFDEVAGAQRAKDQLRQVADMLLDKTKYDAIGAKLSKGMLLIGQPGNGKTLMARAFAKLVGCNFYVVNGTDLCDKKFVGTGAQAVDGLFKAAHANGPSIIFIDEIDAVAGKRGEQGESPSLNTLLSQIDGFEPSDDIFVIGATNCREKLDSAITRSGRLDSHVYVPRPDRAVREKILEIHTRKVLLDPTVDLAEIATKTGGFSGADLQNLINQSALCAVRSGHSAVLPTDIDESFKIVCAGRHTDFESRMTFADVIGAYSAKNSLQEAVDYLKNPAKYGAMGARASKGILIAGPPGNGKTSLARAVAGEADCAFYYKAATDFVGKYVGTGVERVRAFFDDAKQNSPAVIFIDEIDAIGTKRGTDSGGGAIADANKTLNELLVQIDGFADSNVIVIAATNRPEVLDSALTRPGRLETTVFIHNPARQERYGLLKHFTKDVQLGSDVDLDIIAKRGYGTFSGAAMMGIVNQAKLFAVKAGRAYLNMDDFNQAIDHIALGREDYTVKMSDEELENTAYHECGHALVPLLKPSLLSSLTKITIIPRTMANGLRMLGVALSLGEDKHQMTKAEYLARIEMCFGGLVAEELIFGADNVSSGPRNDLEQATNIARAMVCSYGMSDLGFAVITPKAQSAMQKEINDEINKILNQCYDNCKQLITTNIDLLHKLAAELIKEEQLLVEDIYPLLGLAPR